MGAWREALDPSRKEFLKNVMDSNLAGVNSCLGGIHEAQGMLAMFGGLDTVAFTPPPITLPDEIPVPDPV